MGGTVGRWSSVLSLLWAGQCSVQLLSTCLIMCSRHVSRLTWGDAALKPISSGWANSGLWEGPSEWVCFWTISDSVFVPTVSCIFPTLVGGPPMPKDRPGPISYGVIAFFPWPSTHETLCIFQEWSFCFPKSCGSPAVKPFWPSKPDPPGTPPLAGPLGWEAWHGAQNSHFCGIISAV